MDFSVDLIFSLTFLFVFHLLPRFSTQEFHPSPYTCPKDFQCGNLGNLTFPFTNFWHPNCGLCMMNCSAHHLPGIKFNMLSEVWFEVKNMSGSKFRLYDPAFQSLLEDQSCYSFFYNIYPPPFPSVSLVIASNITLFRCPKGLKQGGVDYFRGYRRNGACEHFDVYYKNPKSQSSNWDWKTLPTGCESVVHPIHSNNITDNTELFQFLSAEFDLEWHLSDECYDCHLKGGFCDQADGGKFHCTYAETRTGNKKLRIIIGAAIGGVAVLMIAFAIFLVLRCKKWINNPFYKLSSKPEIAGRNVSFGVPIFSYAELEEATNNFDASKELGDGGFGIVYYGKLRDGREVAVKRLYEHNYKRMAQFMNEVEILTCLRHRNLVSLYGCTSRQSRELLVVYEYIPNGTVADHLHGDRAKDKLLTWPVRMSIAMETANALAYLHASDIIHRDVKTNNILLDHNFQVKVADFGLSRLLPNDVSHVSTAPQGTPGYVDPEYHQCYIKVMFIASVLS